MLVLIVFVKSLLGLALAMDSRDGRKEGSGMSGQVRSGCGCQRTSREASAYVTNNSLSMRTASAACFSSRRCERVRASFSKAVWGSVVLFGPARLYDVRGFWARALNLPFWSVSFVDL